MFLSCQLIYDRKQITANPEESHYFIITEKESTNYYAGYRYTIRIAAKDDRPPHYFGVKLYFVTEDGSFNAGDTLTFTKYR